MTLIKCPECDKEISDTANVCIHCGYKIKKKTTKVIIHSYNELFAINPSVKIYENNLYITEIVRGQTIELVIDEDTLFTFKSSISKVDVMISINNDITEIMLSFNRVTGALEAIINIKNNDTNSNIINENTYKNTVKKKKKWNIFWLILAIVIILLIIFEPESSEERAINIVLDHPYKEYRDAGYGTSQVHCDYKNGDYQCNFGVFNKKTNSYTFHNYLVKMNGYLWSCEEIS